MTFKPSTTDKALAPETAKSHEGAATLFIDGAWSAAAAGRTRTIECPADGSFVAEVAEADASDTERAIAAADAAFRRTGEDSWASWTTAQRGQLVLDIAAAIRQRKDEFAWAESMDTGKRLPLSLIHI